MSDSDDDDFDWEQNDRDNETVNGPYAEEFARALDRMGWAITWLADPGRKWSLDPRYGPVPKWADDMGLWGKPKSQFRVIDGGQSAH
jgi:hypothetical protein